MGTLFARNTMRVLAWRNLWRNKRRTWLTIGAMIFSNVLLIFMITLQFGTYDMMIENGLKAFSSHIQLSAEGYQQDPKLRTYIKDLAPLTTKIKQQHPDLNFSVRASAFSLAASEKRSLGLQVIGVNPEQEPAISSIPGLITQGQYFEKQSQGEPLILLGSILARNLKANVGDELTLLGSDTKGSFAAGVFIVGGIFESGIDIIDRHIAQITLKEFQVLFDMEASAHTIMINAQNIGEAPDRLDQLKTLINNNEPPIEIFGWEDRHPEIKQTIQSDMAGTWFMFSVLVILVTFSVLNTQLMSVLERTREFGIIMVIGLRPSKLSQLIMLETVMMASLGLIIGVALGSGLATYLHIYGFTYPGIEEMAAKFNVPEKLYPMLSPSAILLGPSIVFGGCILAAIYPAARIHALHPVKAMRKV